MTPDHYSHLNDADLALRGKTLEAMTFRLRPIARQITVSAIAGIQSELARRRCTLEDWERSVPWDQRSGLFEANRLGRISS